MEKNKKNKKTTAGKKIVVGITTACLTAIIGTSAYLIGSNWQSIKAGLKGQTLFTQEQVQEQVDKAYQDGLGESKKFQDIINDLTDNLRVVQSNLTKMTAERDQLKIAYDTEQSNNQNLTEQIAQITQEINKLKSEKAEDIATINALSSELEKSKQLLSTSNELQQSLATQVNELNNTIDALTGDVEYYKELINQYKDENKASATFILDDGSTVSMKFIEKGTAIGDLPVPEDNDYFTFEYWAVNGVQVDSNYIVEEDTVFIAVGKRYYTATFIYEDVTTDTIKVARGDIAIPENTPEDTAYKRLNGWKVNGVLVNRDSYPISSNVTFVADVIYSYDVTFDTGVDDLEVNPQIVDKNGYAQKPTTPTHEYYTFMYWSIDGTNKVDLDTYPITAQTTFIAVWQKEYNQTYVVAGQTINQTLNAGEKLTFPELNLDSDCTLIGYTTKAEPEVYNAEDLSNVIVKSEETYYAIIKKTIQNSITLTIPVAQYGNEFSYDVSNILNIQNKKWAGCSGCYVSATFNTYTVRGQSSTILPTSKYTPKQTFSSDSSFNSTVNGTVYKGKVSIRYLNGKVFATCTTDSSSSSNITAINITISNPSYFI